MFLSEVLIAVELKQTTHCGAGVGIAVGSLAMGPVDLEQKN
jgi:hypothetical protein